MYIVIDISSATHIVFHSFDSVKSFWHTSEVPFFGDVLAPLVHFLESQGRSAQDLVGVGVVQHAQGTFSTSRRLAIMVNALAFALNVPVVRCPEFTSQTVQELFKQASVGTYVLPVYAGELRITFPQSL